MATKIRAYKLAEELGIDRNDIVEKAATIGIVLKSAMAVVTDDDVVAMRTKLGGVKKGERVVEERVEAKSGRTVIRRRKKAAPPPEEPKPEAPVELEAAVADPAAEPVAEDVAAPAAVELEGSVPEPIAEPEAAPAPPEPQPEAEPERVAAAAPPPPSGGVRPPPPIRAPAPDAPGPAPAGTAAAAAEADRKGKQRKRVREVVNLKEQEQYARQMTGRGPQRRVTVVDPRQMTSPRKKRRDALAKPAARAAAPAEQKKIVRIEGAISVGELAKQIGIKAAQLQGKLMALGTMVSVNQAIEVDTVETLAIELGFDVQDVGFKEEEFLTQQAAVESSEEAAEGTTSRPPVITVMGHVDHGKTSLLDAIRKTSVVDGEAGGITQHIGAYQTQASGMALTFIDTPGHAAFTAMRARGAEATDLVVLVVAATDGVMPQTIEAIDHARAAGCPIVVAVNKIDLPGADPLNARQKLMEHGLVSEEFGGDTICVDVSAIKGTGLDQLLEMISLQSELLELKATPENRASGVVLEAKLDKGRGPVATVLIQDGTLKTGDTVVVGTQWGRVRSMEDHLGGRLKLAGPSTPVQLIGLGGVPEAGAQLNVVESERVAKQIVDHRESLDRGQTEAPRPRMSLEDIFAAAEGEEKKELPVVLKADVHGTLEAVTDALNKLSTDRVELKVLSAAVGGITESDVTLAKASNGIIVGFNVRPDPAGRKMSEGQGIEIRVYQIIYELIDDVKAAMAGLLPPTIKENVIGRAEVRQSFTIPKTGTIAGSYITEGMIKRSSSVRLIRDGVQIYEGKLGSLKRFKDDAREVQTGFECGIGIDGYNDIKLGDVIEAFELEESPATL